MIALKQTLLSPIASDVYEGLARGPKTLPPKLFYDEAGSKLFDEITRLPEYYLTRTELGILREHAREVAARIPSGISVTELGSGSGSKTRVLLRALTSRYGSAHYVPVDISPAALAEVQRGMQRIRHVQVRPVVADIGEGFDFLAFVPPPRLVLYIGSSIGNFDSDEAARFLLNLRRHLSAGDSLLLGTDLAKDRSVLLDAYNDAAGVTAAFNLNVLARINRELGGRFDLRSFRHIAVWNEKQSRIEMHLASTRAQTVDIRDLRLSIRFERGETIHTENSYKYTVEGARTMLRDAGFAQVETWTDAKKWFAVHWADVD